MACTHYKKGYFGVCCAFKPHRVASIAQMEQYCFKDNFVECPHFGDSVFGKNPCAGSFISFRNEFTVKR